MPLFQEIMTIDRREGDETMSTEDLVHREVLKLKLATRIQMEEIS